jgi:dCMP deaminase
MISVHAELNVIAYAARHGSGTEGCTLYITHSPCYTCAGAIISAGIERVVFSDIYKGYAGLNKLALAGIEYSGGTE